MKFIVTVLRKISRYAWKLSAFLEYIRIGKTHNYPTCCAVHFAWDVVVKHEAPALKRGGIMYPEGRSKVWVPCWFHRYVKRHPNWESYSGQQRGQLKLFKETRNEAKDRRRRERERVRETMLVRAVRRSK